MKILLTDDEKLIREGLAIILNTYEDIEIAGEASNGLEALEMCRNQHVDIVLMDIRMPECDGVRGTRLIREACPDTKVLMLTTFDDAQYIKDAMRYGASGYLLKDSDYDLIYQSLKAVHKGNVVIHPDAADKLIHEQDNRCSQNVQDVIQKFQLTRQEVNIMKEVAEGRSNKEIADKFFLSEGTVKNHISSILSKLDLKNRTQITIFVYKHHMEM